MPSEERERQFERALQRQMRGGSTDAACPDAEALAAYHERTLSLEELAKWKEHIAGCTRCQETLALVEETSSIALHDWEKKGTALAKSVHDATVIRPKALRSVREEPFDQAEELVPQTMGAAAPQKERGMARVSWKWAAPAGALAAGLLIFVAVRENQQQVKPAQTAVEVAQNREAAAPTSQPEAIPQAPKLGEPGHRDAQLEPRLDQKAAPRQKRMAPPATASQSTGQGYGSGSAADQGDKKLKDEEGTPKGMELAAKATAAEAQARADLDATRVANAAPPAAAPPPALRVEGRNVIGASAGLKKQREAQEDKAKAVGAVTETVEVTAAAPVANSMERSRVAAPLQEIAAKDSHVIQERGGKHGWRVGAGGMIEATADGGKKWKAQVSGEASDLSGGSAPSKNVCWVVGKAGTILLTTDGGKHWKRVSSPLQEDLRGVDAVDAKQASIRYLPNNKSFQTTDGGATWAPTAKQ